MVAGAISEPPREPGDDHPGRHREWAVDDPRWAAQRALREVASNPAWTSYITAALSVADAADALVGGDRQRAYVLAQAALEAEPSSPIEHAHALEVQAAVLSGRADGLTRATELLVKAVEAHKLSGSEVRDQARVLTRLAEHHRALSSPHDACLDLNRSLGLLASSEVPDQRLLVLDRYLLASSLAEVGEVMQAARTFAAAQSLPETLTIVDVVSQELIVDVDGRQHLLDDLRFREKAARVDLIRTDWDGPALLRELHEWHQLATDLGRTQSDLRSIERKVALVELEIGRRGGA